MFIIQLWDQLFRHARFGRGRLRSATIRASLASNVPWLVQRHSPCEEAAVGRGTSREGIATEYLTGLIGSTQSVRLYHVMMLLLHKANKLTS
jgi:hypothetical protein